MTPIKCTYFTAFFSSAEPLPTAVYLITCPLAERLNLTDEQ